jgi:hypothetical protein
MTIELTNKVIDKRYSLEKGSNKVCTNCSNKMRALYNYHDLPYKLCELCNTVYRYSTRRMYAGIVCQTDLTQLDIVNKTYEFLKKNKRIPKVSEVDESAKIINYPFPDLLKAIKNSTKKQRLKFKNVKLFFTDMIDYDSFPFTSMFWRPVKYPEYQFFEVVNSESGKIDLTSEQKGIIELYIDDISLDASDDQGPKSKSKPKSKPRPNRKTNIFTANAKAKPKKKMVKVRKN